MLELRQLFLEGGRQETFYAGVSGALCDAIAQHGRPGLRLTGLQEVVAELARDEELRVAGRIFQTSVRYLETADPRALLALPLEQRRVARRLLGQDQ